MEVPTAHRNAPSEHSGVPVGFFFEKAMLWPFLQNARPSGSLRSPSVCVPNQLFKLLRCSAWLIHDFAPSPMRALVFRSAYSASRNARASAAFAASIKAHRAVSSETLMLQVRFARPPVGGGSFAPPCTPLSCPRKCGDRQAAIPLCGKSSLTGARNEFLARSAYPQEACPFLRTPPRPAAKRAASTRAATPLPPPVSSFFLTARSSFRTSRRP